ncbi:MAG: hypothetical protein PWQ79_2180 [Thermococcaceae archaeon]|nr:hypothetical protein [Thermococcaceae archaeon]
MGKKNNEELCEYISGIVRDPGQYTTYLLTVKVLGENTCGGLDHYGTANYSRVREAITSPDIPVIYALGCITGTTLCVAGYAMAGGITLGSAISEGIRASATCAVGTALIFATQQLDKLFGSTGATMSEMALPAEILGVTLYEGYKLKTGRESLISGRYAKISQRLENLKYAQNQAESLVQKATQISKGVVLENDTTDVPSIVSNLVNGAKDAGLEPPEGFSSWDNYGQQVKEAFEAWKKAPDEEETAVHLLNLTKKGQKKVTEAMEKLKNAKTFYAPAGQIIGTLFAGIYATQKYLKLPKTILE